MKLMKEPMKRGEPEDLTRAPLDRVPKEILALIFSHLIKDPDHATEDIKNLRLAHPSFARLQPIRDFLFKSITSRPTRERLSDTTALHGISPLVQHIIFEPVPMASRASVRQVANMLNIFPNANHLTISDKSNNLISKTPPRYIATGPEIRLLSDLVFTALSTSTFTLTHLELDIQLNDLVDILSLDSCKRLGVDGVRTLSFSPLSPGEKRIPPQHQSYPYREALHERRSLYHDFGEEVNNTFLTHINEYGDASLQTFICSGLISYPPFFQWPDSYAPNYPVPSTPFLTTIILSDTSFDMAVFTTWVKSSPALSSLSLLRRTRLTSIPGQTMTACLPLLQAIRIHPSRMKLRFQEAQLFDGVDGPWTNTVISLQYHTAETAEDLSHLHRVENCRSKARILQKMKTYLSGKGQWLTNAEERSLMDYGNGWHVSDRPADCCDEKWLKRWQWRDYWDCESGFKKTDCY